MIRKPAIYSSAFSKIQNPASLTTEQLFEEVGRNTGNMAFFEGIQRVLDQKSMSSVPYGNPRAVYDVGADVCVLPCANQFGAHCDMGGEADHLERANVPVVAIGLGAEAKSMNDNAEPPPGTKRWVEVISSLAASNASNIAVRGAYTYSQLERFGLHKRAVVLGCPSNMISADKRLGQKIAAKAERFFLGDRDRIAIVPGHPWWPRLRRIEASLVALLGKQQGGFIVQNPLEMFYLARGEFEKIDPSNLDYMRSHFMPNAASEEFLRFAQGHASIFSSASEWMDDYTRFDFVIGPRIHGVILALQAGVPGICIAHDARTRELCETMKVPMVSAEEVEVGIARNQLASLFRFDADEFDRTRAALAKGFCEFLAGNQLPVADYLQDLASTKSDTAKGDDNGRTFGNIRADACNSSSVEAKVRGVVDHFAKPNVISGWAYEGDSTTPCAVIVKNEGKVIGLTEAKLHRPDLVEVNNGLVGFSVTCEGLIEANQLSSGLIEVFAIPRNGKEIPLNLWENLQQSLTSGSDQA